MPPYIYLHMKLPRRKCLGLLKGLSIWDLVDLFLTIVHFNRLRHTERPWRTFVSMSILPMVLWWESNGMWLRWESHWFLIQASSITYKQHTRIPNTHLHTGGFHWDWHWHLMEENIRLHGAAQSKLVKNPVSYVGHRCLENMNQTIPLHGGCWWGGQLTFHNGVWGSSTLDAFIHPNIELLGPEW